MAIEKDLNFHNIRSNSGQSIYSSQTVILTEKKSPISYKYLVTVIQETFVLILLHAIVKGLGQKCN